MNVSLMPSDINLEFYFHPVEIHKSEDEVKLLYYNHPGTLIAIVTKTNLLKVFDSLGKVVLFTVSYFKDFSLIINFLCWSTSSEVIYINYENKKTSISGVKTLSLLYESPSTLFHLSEEEFNVNRLKECKLHSAKKQDDTLFLSGGCPMIYEIETKQFTHFFKDEEGIPSCTFIIKETVEANSYFLFVKELYMIMLIKENSSTHSAKSKYLKDHISAKNLSEGQNELFNWADSKVADNFTLVDLYSLNINGEITQISLNSNKNLILVNSTDRVLRLFRYDFDNIVLLKDYFDSVNRRKWINAHFYTFKSNSLIQDLLVSALSDNHSLEFVFIQIETGNFLKRLEPFKYQCSDFICHYLNHFTLVLVSGKKLFHVIGYLVDNWAAFAPQLKYIEENIEFIEDEAYFDNFNNYLKKQTSSFKQKETHLRNIFQPKTSPHEKLFMKYTPSEDQVSLQSQKDLQELFHEFNEIFEYKNNI